MNLYCLFDRKGLEHSCIQCLINHDIAKRSVAAVVNNPDKSTLLAVCPGDFELYCLGSFDTKTGVIVPDRVFLCNCAELVKEDK